MRKTKFIFLGAVLGTVAWLFIAASIDYRALNTNQFTGSGTVTIKPGALFTNVGGDNPGLSNVASAVIAGSAGTAGTAALIDNSPWSTVKYPDGGNGIEYAFRVTTVSGTFDIVLHTNGSLSIPGIFYGDGSGITNLAQIVSEVTFLNNVLMQSNITVSGKATFNNNVFFLTTETMTNAAPTGYVDFGKDSFTLSTNNTVSFAAAQNWSTSNMNDTIINFTNNGATPKTAFAITLHGTYQNMKAEEGNTVYCTNVGQLLVWGQQGFTGTNFYWKSR